MTLCATLSHAYVEPYHVTHLLFFFSVVVVVFLFYVNLSFLLETLRDLYINGF